MVLRVHDRSPGSARTHLLLERTVPMVDRLVRLSGLLVIHSLSREVADLVRPLQARDR